MPKKALVVIDIQNDITKNYKEIIGNINKAKQIGIEAYIAEQNEKIAILKNCLPTSTTGVEKPFSVSLSIFWGLKTEKNHTAHRN